MSIKKLNYFILLLSLTLITSCSDDSKISIITNEGLVKLEQLTIEQFGGETEVYSFSIYSEEDLSAHLGSMTIEYFKEDREIYANTYNAITYGEEPNLTGEEKREQITKFRPKWKTPEGNGKIKIKDIDFGHIIPNILTAKEILGDNVANVYIKYYDIKVEAETNALIANFKLQYTPEENATTLEGRNIVTNYQEADFKVDVNGEVILKE